MRLVRAGGYWTAASSKQKAKSHSDECFYLLRRAQKSGNGLAWRVATGAGSRVPRPVTESMTQFPAGHSDRAFQLKEDTVSPGAHLPGSRPGRTSKNTVSPLFLETEGSPSLSRQ